MLKPSVVKHRNYKNFTNDEFRRALLKELSLTNLQKGEFDRCKYLVARAKKVLLFPEISQLKFLLPLTCPHIQMCISIRRYIYIYIYILIKTHTHTHTLREKCPNTEFFWSVFSHIRNEYRDLRSKSRYSVWMRENADEKKLRIWTLFTQWHTKTKSKVKLKKKRETRKKPKKKRRRKMLL